MRSCLRGWARHQSSTYNKQKEQLLNIIDLLDRKAETNPLCEAERQTFKLANEENQ